MKRFICAASFVLAFAMAIPAAQAAGPLGAKVPHLTSSGYNPNNQRHSYFGNYYIRIHVTGQMLAQLMIETPSDMQLSEVITITDQAGKPVNATVSLNAQKATIAFAQAVAPDTTLTIDLKKVRTPLDPPTWFIAVFSQLAELNGEIPLGLARIQPQPRD
jgi:Protein of unknown function (DUF2808)